eukprot:9481109-Pyramimonas_sp.AAC.1
MKHRPGRPYPSVLLKVLHPRPRRRHRRPPPLLPPPHVGPFGALLVHGRSSGTDDLPQDPPAYS